MQLEDRLSAFLNLGKRLESIDNVTLSTLTEKTKSENSWFTDNNVVMALTGVRRLLEARALETWVSGYNIPPLKSPSEVALILAGNIPCVGFHDILCVLITGNRAQIKRSSKDSVLITFILDSLVKIDYRFEEYISFTEKVKNFDAVIATGSDNSSRYFDYYFSKYPSIIRKNRTSVAIMSGTESAEDIQQLGVDIFSYFGLGCRNVSKIFVPEKYSIPMLFDHWKKFEPVICHHKYANNYDYQKAIMMVNKTPFYDSGFVLITESKNLVSPISVVYYETYHSISDLTEKLIQAQNKIQCIVRSIDPASIPFGQAQFPGPGDYADKVDTMKFLIGLSKA